MRNQCNVKGETGTKVKRAYLQCKGNKKYHTCNNNKSIRYDIIEKYVLDSINDLLKNCNQKILKDEFNETLQRQNRQEILITNLNKEKSNLEKKLNESKLYFKNLYTDKMKGIISEDDFSMLREEYTKDVESYQTRFEDIEKQLDEIEERKDNSKDIDSILKKYKNIKKLTRIIVEEFIEKIYVSALDKNTNTREIKIEWNLDL
jgi:hypothetical protein